MTAFNPNLLLFKLLQALSFEFERETQIDELVRRYKVFNWSALANDVNYLTYVLQNLTVKYHVCIVQYRTIIQIVLKKHSDS